MLQTFLILIYSFFKIGLLTIGGGLVIVPIIQREMAIRGWMTTEQFLDILGIAQATPGPVGVNTATFVGYRVIESLGGSLTISLLGALIATLAVSSPSIICVHFAGGWFERNRAKPWVQRAFLIIRPLVALLVVWAGYDLSRECLTDVTHFVPIAVGVAAFLITVTRHFSPLWGLAIGALSGLIPALLS